MMLAGGRGTMAVVLIRATTGKEPGAFPWIRAEKLKSPPLAVPFQRLKPCCNERTAPRVA